MAIGCFIAAFCALSGPALAQGCPNHFRFVEFGISEPGGALIRGGTIFRVEVGGAIVVQAGSARCRDVDPVFRDGRNHPIPVVDAFGYRPDAVGNHLTDLTVTRAWDTAETLAMHNARAHRTALDSIGAQVTTGADFLCVHVSDRVSCEVVNPFDRRFPLVVHCTATACSMPVLAVDDTIILGAAWKTPIEATIDAIGHIASETVTTIHAFISENMSG